VAAAAEKSPVLSGKELYIVCTRNLHECCAAKQLYMSGQRQKEPCVASKRVLQFPQKSSASPKQEPCIFRKTARYLAPPRGGDLAPSNFSLQKAPYFPAMSLSQKVLYFLQMVRGGNLGTFPAKEPDISRKKIPTTPHKRALYVVQIVRSGNLVPKQYFPKSPTSPAKRDPDLPQQSPVFSAKEPCISRALYLQQKSPASPAKEPYICNKRTPYISSKRAL